MAPSELAPADGVGVRSGGGSSGGAEASGSGLSHEIAHPALPPADLNATRPAPLSDGSLAVTQITLLPAAFNWPWAGCTSSPPEVVADHETVALRARAEDLPGALPDVPRARDAQPPGRGRPGGGTGGAGASRSWGRRSRRRSGRGGRGGCGNGRLALPAFLGVGVGAASVSGSSSRGSGSVSKPGSSVISAGSVPGAVWGSLNAPPGPGPARPPRPPRRWRPARTPPRAATAPCACAASAAAPAAPPIPLPLARERRRCTPGLAVLRR